MNEKYLLAPGFYERLQKLGVKHVQAIVSDAWDFSKDAPWPGDGGDWSKWEAVVEDAVRKAQSKKLKVEWDVWNEPNHPFFWRRDQARYFETWRRGVLRIRALDSKAVIVGPSLGWYDKPFLDSFLIYAKANGVVPDIFCWHELVEGNGIPAGFPARVLQMRQTMKEKNIVVKRFSINEIIPNDRQFSPAVTVSYFAGVERTDVDGACHTCWGDDGTPEKPVNNCFNNSLAGLLTPDTKQPRSSWWAYKAYGDMVGQFVSLVRDTNYPFDGMAAYDERTRRASIVLGNTSKDQAFNLRLNLINLDHAKDLVRNGEAHLVVEQIPFSGKAALEKPSMLLNERVRPQNGAFQISVTNVLPDSVLIVRLEKR